MNKLKVIMLGQLGRNNPPVELSSSPSLPLSPSSVLELVKNFRREGLDPSVKETSLKEKGGMISVGTIQKLMLVSTSGGHFSTMNGLKPFWSSHQRVWVTDFKGDTAVLAGKEQVHWLRYQGPRDLLAFAFNLPKVFKILSDERPDLVISTGASIAVSFALVAKVLGIRFIYVESISRSKELSLSGKLVYPLCDEFYVQWPGLCQKYPRAIFKGYV